VDSTAMVGQMISLNQLDQLISINEAITDSSTTASTTNAAKIAGATTSASLPNSVSNNATSTLSPSAAAAATSQLPFDPNTMMPIGYGTTGMAASSINSSINASPVVFSGSANKTLGGK
jgi:flagellar basal-body rod modification protein FlgD